MGRDRIRASKKRGKHVRRFGWDEGRPRIGRGAGGARAARRGWRGGCGTCESVRLLRLVGPFLGPERARCGCWQCGWPRWRDCQPALHSCGPGQCIQTPPAIVPFSSESFFAAPNGCPKTSATRSAFVNAYYAATPAHVCAAPRTADWNFSTGWEDASWAVDGGSKPMRTSAEVIRWPAPPPPPPLAAPMRTPPRGLRVEVMETRGVLGVPRDGMLFVDYDRDWSAVAEELEIDGPQDGEGGLVSPAFYQLPSLASAAASSAPRRQRLPWE